MPYEFQGRPCQPSPIEHQNLPMSQQDIIGEQDDKQDDESRYNISLQSFPIEIHS